MSRKKARAAALQALYALDVGRIPEEVALNHVVEENGLAPSDAAFTRTLVSGVLQHRQRLDELLAQYAIGWEVERMPVVDRNILRLGLYELLYLREEIPASVSINEAIELAKVFSNEEAGPFINGVLDSIRRDLDAGKPEDETAGG
ncbi:MAG TPA: transcription antitermination factor NusB [Peptococcaceae bacterium]|nr:MAG: N utilization substance protein B-like protein [Moorella sp. 60_41]HBT47180.1 transcription antitermination factor NusB [Peptococcaceae bacterium]